MTTEQRYAALQELVSDCGYSTWEQMIRVMGLDALILLRERLMAE